MMWEESRFHQPDCTAWRSLLSYPLLSYHQSPLWYHHLIGWCNGHVHVGQWTALGGQQSRPRESTLCFCLNSILRWEELSLALLHCCALSCWLLCPANAARIPRGKSHRCTQSRQPGSRRRGSPLGHSTSPLDSRWGCSSPAGDQQLTKTQPIDSLASLLWPGSLQGFNLNHTLDCFLSS